MEKFGETRPSQTVCRLFDRLRSLLRSRKTLPLIVLTMVLAIVAGAIIISSVTRKHVHLDDGTVWVTSLKDRKAARFNVKIRDSTGAISSPAARFDLAQHDGDTVINEGRTSSQIMQSTLSVGGKTPTKDSTTTSIGGGSIAFLNSRTGNVWSGKASNIESISPSTAEPQMKLGSQGRIAVSQDGTVYGYRPSDGMVLVLDQPVSHHPRQWGSLSKGRMQNAEDFTVIDDVPVIVVGGTIIWKDGQAQSRSREKISLQAPPTDDFQKGWVTAYDSKGIHIVRLKSGKQQVRTYLNSSKGHGAKPVSTAGCVHAAWSRQSHNYVKICSPDLGNVSFQTLQNVTPTSSLIFRTNHRLVVLNDILNGNVWNPDDSTMVIKIQWKTLQTQQTSQQNQDDKSVDNHHDFSKTCSSQSGQIKANDDEFGARAGSRQILDVLRNDEQTDCSVLQIARVGAPEGSNISISPIYNGRYLQLDASGASQGTATLHYEISDGRGQSSTAKTTIKLTASSGNHQPKQTDRPPEYDVEQGASFTTNALGSFSDPDGDPLTLVSASAQNNDQVVVSTRADGQLVFKTGSMSSGRAVVEVTVSDGQSTGTGPIYFSVRQANTLPATIDGVVKETIPDQNTTVDLKPYVHGTSTQPPALASVDATGGSAVNMNSADLSFTFKTSRAGTYYLPYTIIQGTMQSIGMARLEVRPKAQDGAKPIAANDVALLGADHTAIVEPLTNDVDPMGGVLSVTTVSASPDLGIKTGLVSHKRIYLTARKVPSKPVNIAYTVANAAGSSTGTITLQPPALATNQSTPKASNVDLRVRAGGITSVNVLDHVSHGDGTTITLKPDLQYDRKTLRGLAFVSGDTVRYQASGIPGNYQLTYTVSDNLGNAASALITIAVHRKDAGNKPAPTPKDIEAQVAAGQKVRIPIPLTGIDVDGDDDILQGLGNDVPKLGRISEVGADHVVYEAYGDSYGTDSFSYAVEDWTGQRAHARIHVGIFKGSSNSSVYARDDAVSLRPNTTASIPVILNDVSENGMDLKVDKHLQMQGISGATIKDNLVSSPRDHKQAQPTSSIPRMIRLDWKTLLH